jgi:hypothetical protein
VGHRTAAIARLPTRGLCEMHGKFAVFRGLHVIFIRQRAARNGFLILSRFISVHPRRPRFAPHAVSGCKESHVRNIHIEAGMRQRALDVEDTVVENSSPRFTAGEFFKDAGGIIAICLGLGLLMQVLLG